MVTLKLHVDDTTYERLGVRAIDHRRSIERQAEIELIRLMERVSKRADRRAKKEREQAELYAELVGRVMSGEVTLSALDPSETHFYAEPERIVPRTVYREVSSE